MFKYSIIFTSLLVLAIGCASSAADGELPASDLADTLLRGASFDVEPDEESHVAAEAAALRLDRVSPIDFAIETGALEIRADAEGSLGLDGLFLELGDISVPADVFPPAGIVLTDVSVELAGTATAAAEWTADGDRADVSLDVSLALKWSVLRDGRPLPLADIVVENVPVFLAVEQRDGGQTLTLSADRSGSFWSWANTFELRDLSVELAATR